MRKLRLRSEERLAKDHAQSQRLSLTLKPRGQWRRWRLLAPELGDGQEGERGLKGSEEGHSGESVQNAIMIQFCDELF